MENRIIEGNKLIAEFMGAKMLVSNYYGINIIEFPDNRTYDLLGLKYHSSWDWLMPVVIECFNRYDAIESNNTNHQFILNDALIECNIESLYKAVVNFIEWYNSQH
jgi:hypothetical protein